MTELHSFPIDFRAAVCRADFFGLLAMSLEKLSRSVKGKTKRLFVPGSPHSIDIFHHRTPSSVQAVQHTIIESDKIGTETAPPESSIYKKPQITNTPKYANQTKHNERKLEEMHGKPKKKLHI